MRNSKQLLWKPEEINDVTKFYVLCQHLLSSNISGKVNPEKLSRSVTADRLLLFCDMPVPVCTGFLAPGFCVKVDIAHTSPSRHSRCIFMYIITTIKKPMIIKTIIKWAL